MTQVANPRGPLGLKPDKADAPKERKPMRKVSQKRVDYWKSPRGKFDLEYMAAVKKLHCVICNEWCMRQETLTEAHHVIHGRYSARKSDNVQVIPLCACHHRGTAGSDKVAIHNSPAKWARLYGPDHGFIEATQDKIARIFGLKVEERPK